MTVNSTTSRVSYAGNGVTVTFSVPFYFLAAADLVVIRTASNGTQTTLVLSTDYTVAGAGNPSGGSITCTVAPAATESLVILRDPAATQLTDYQPNDPFPAETHERALDKLTMLAQRLRNLIDRSFRLSDGDTTTASTTLPTPASNQLIGWNGAGNGLQNVPLASLATAVAYGTMRYQTFAGDGVTTTFALTHDPATISNLDVSVSGVVQVPNVDYLLTGQNVIFTTAPPNGTTILVRYGQALGSTPSDAGDISFLQAGTDAQVRTVQSKLREFVSVKDFGADPTGATDSTTAIQAALNASKWVDFGRKGDTYTISGQITVQTGSWLSFHGATVTQTANQTPMFDVRNTTGVVIEGGNFVGKAESPFTNSPSSLAICVRGAGATNLSVRNNTFTGFCYSPLMVALPGTNIEFVDNFVTGPGAAVLGSPALGRRNCTGVTILANGIIIRGNTFKDTAQGLIVGQDSTDVVIEGNLIQNAIVEHGMYIDTGVRRITISNNVVRDTAAVGIKVQWYDAYGVVPSDTAIVGNTIQNTGTYAGGDGIVVLNSVQDTVATITGITNANPAVFTTSSAHGLTAGDIIQISGVSGMVNASSAVSNVVNDVFVVATTPLSTTFTVNTYEDAALNTTGWSAYTSGGTVKKPIYGVNFTIVGNTCRTIGQDGISARYVRNGIIADNVVDTVTRIGIAGLYLSNFSIDNNLVSNVQENGISAFAPLKPTFIRNNSLFNCGAAGIDTNGRSSGMLIDGNGGSYILNNTVVGESTQTKMFYGIQIASGDKRQFVVNHNVIQRAESAGIVLWNDTPNVYPLKSLLRNISESAAGVNAYSGLATAIPGLGTSQRDFFGNAAPASGAWLQGDKVWAQNPAAGGPLGWVCLVGGSPGTWYPFGAVQGSNAYAVTNPSTDRSLNVTGDTTAQVAAVLGTLIADLQGAGILRS